MWSGVEEEEITQEFSACLMPDMGVMVRSGGLGICLPLSFVQRAKVESMRDGFGVHAFDNAHSYIGNWREGFKQGRGTEIGAEGSVYIGNQECGVAHGEGMLQLSDHKSFWGLNESAKMGP